MKLSDFLVKYNGLFVDFDGVYGAQCMDLMHQYIVDVLGLPDGRILAASGAKDVFLNFESLQGHENFIKIANTPTGIPQEGDIVLFGTTVGPYGHVCIFLEGNAKTFNSYDANWPIGSPCHQVTHNYTGCLGWLRFNQAVQPHVWTEEEVTAIRIERDKNFNMLTESRRINEELQNERDGLNSQIKSYQDYIKQLSATLNCKPEQTEILGEIVRLIAVEDTLRNTQKNLENEKNGCQDFLNDLRLILDLPDIDKEGLKIAIQGVYNERNAKEGKIADLTEKLSQCNIKLTAKNPLDGYSKRELIKEVFRRYLT